MSEKLFISDRCVFESLDNELIILNLKTGIYHQLNAIGIVIWNEIKESNPSENELIDSLKKRFSDRNIENDVKLFVADLLQRKLIFKN